MAKDVFIAGVAMTALGKRLGDSVKSMTAEAVTAALADAGAEAKHIQAAWFANTRQPMLEGQNAIRGQVALRPLGLSGLPIVNVENACASGSTAVWEAVAHLRGGAMDVVLVVGAEKMFFPDRPEQVAAAFRGGTDIEDQAWLRDFTRQLDMDGDEEPARHRSIFMDIYAGLARTHMAAYGTTQEDIAFIAAKNHTASQFNPKAQYRVPMTTEQVLADALIVRPLTRAMCAPVSDGAAAAVLCTEAGLATLAVPRSRAVKVRACVLRSGTEHDAAAVDLRVGRLSADEAYVQAGVDPAHIDVAEVHDATSFGELLQIENLRLAEVGGVPECLRRGDFALGGRTPVNPSGGLVSKGHPIAVTGIGQLYELCLHLRGEGGARQVAGARLAVAENGGGFLRGEEGACVITVLEGAA